MRKPFQNWDTGELLKMLREVDAQLAKLQRRAKPQRKTDLQHKTSRVRSTRRRQR